MTAPADHRRGRYRQLYILAGVDLSSQWRSVAHLVEFRSSVKCKEVPADVVHEGLRNLRPLSVIGPDLAMLLWQDVEAPPPPPPPTQPPPHPKKFSLISCLASTGVIAGKLSRTPLPSQTDSQIGLH